MKIFKKLGKKKNKTVRKCLECQLCYTCEKVLPRERCRTCEICIVCEKEGYGRCRKCEKCYVCEIVGPRGKRLSKDEQFVTALTLFPTDECNFRCKYCFTYGYPRKFKGAMDWETAKQSVDYLLKNSGEAKQVSIHFFGGEPLLEFELIKKMVQYGNKEAIKYNKKIKWGITTNLSLITRDVNKFLRNNNFQVLASIDGWKVSHNINRVYKDGETGTFDAVLKGLEKIMKWRIPEIRWTFTPETIKYIKDDVKKFINMGAKFIALEPVYELPWTEKNYQEYEQMLNDLLDLILELAKENKTISLKPLRDGLNIFRLKERFKDRCGLAKSSVGIGPEGGIYRCHRFVGQEEHQIGNVWKGKDLKKSREINKSWSLEKVHPINDPNQIRCKDCLARIICNAGCLAVNYDTTGSTFIVPEVYCKLNQIKVKIATKLYMKLKNIYPQILEKYLSKMHGVRGPI